VIVPVPIRDSLHAQRFATGAAGGGDGGEVVAATAVAVAGSVHRLFARGANMSLRQIWSRAIAAISL